MKSISHISGHTRHLKEKGPVSRSAGMAAHSKSSAKAPQPATPVFGVMTQSHRTPNGHRKQPRFGSRHFMIRSKASPLVLSRAPNAIGGTMLSWLPPMIPPGPRSCGPKTNGLDSRPEWSSHRNRGGSCSTRPLKLIRGLSRLEEKPFP